MGGEKFDSTHPEGYLFGENSDLNFLGNRPVAVGYNLFTASGLGLLVQWGLEEPGVPLDWGKPKQDKLLRSGVGWEVAAESENLELS